MKMACQLLMIDIMIPTAAVAWDVLEREASLEVQQTLSLRLCRSRWCRRRFL